MKLGNPLLGSFIPVGKKERCDRGWKWRWQVFIILMAHFSMVAGCATPRIQAVDPQLFLNSEMPFIKDGATTREEVSLKLGVPSAQLKGDRILRYRLPADESKLCILNSINLCVLRVLCGYVFCSSTQFEKTIATGRRHGRRSHQEANPGNGGQIVQ